MLILRLGLALVLGNRGKLLRLDQVLTGDEHVLLSHLRRDARTHLAETLPRNSLRIA
jgi:hypothetical protein